MSATATDGGAGTDASGPRVTQVLLASSSWGSAFRSHLADSGLGTVDGYAVPSGPAQAATLPWVMLDQVVIKFDRDVDIQKGDLLIAGVNVALHSTRAFNYSPATHKAVWTLSQPIANDKLTLYLDGTSAAGVRDLSGNLLDGSWTNYASAYPSGSGGAGSNFVFRVNVLRGDYTQDGVVDVSDVQSMAAHWAQGTPMNDGNGDGIVDISEVQLLAYNWSQSMTRDSTPPLAPQFAIAGGSGSAAYTTESSQVDLQGHTSPNVTVRLLEAGATTTSSNTGTFQFTNVWDVLGDTPLTAQALDPAGNASLYRLTIHRDAQDDIFAHMQRPALQLDPSDPNRLVREGAADFNASLSQYLTAADSTLLHPTDQLTVNFRVNQHTLGLDRNIVSKWDYGNGPGTIAIATGPHAGQEGELSVWFPTAMGGFGAIAITDGAKMQAKATYDVSVIYNGNLAPANRVQVFIDGVAQKIVVENGTVPATLFASVAPLNVGKWGGALGRFLDGSIERLTIYGTAKTRDELITVGALSYDHLTLDQKAGLTAWWDFDEPAGQARVDRQNGIALADPTGVAHQELVAVYRDPDSGIDLSQTYARRPEYVAQSPMNNQGAILFDGVNDALVAQINNVLTTTQGDAYLVVRFPSDAMLLYDTLFSLASYDSAKKYMFFSVDTINPMADPTSDGKPHFRLRWRDGDVWNTDIRGQSVVEKNKTYLLHFWGLGPGKGWGMEVNGIDQAPFVRTGYATYVDGSWFGNVTGANNLTMGDFERSDGPQGFARCYLGEVLCFGSKLSPIEDDVVATYLAGKWGVTLGS